MRRSISCSDFSIAPLSTPSRDDRLHLFFRHLIGDVLHAEQAHDERRGAFETA